MNIEKQLEISTSAQYPLRDDEIDLRELFKVLWRGKITIIACTLVFAIAAVVYALNAQQWWTAKAIITTPKVADVVTFSQAVKRYQPAFDQRQSNSSSQVISALKSYQEDEKIISDGVLDNLIGRDRLFERFVEAFNANNNKREYLAQSPIFSEVLNVLEVNTTDPRDYRLVINLWLEKLSVSAEDKKKPHIITLRAESISDQSSYDLLNGYISFINQKVTVDLIADLRSILKIKSNELYQQLESRRDFVTQQLKLEIFKSENALKIAIAAKIRKPVENLNKEEVFAIDLGAEAIKEKINVLKSLEDLSIFDPNIGEISGKLNILARDLPKIEKLALFSYLDAVELPLNRDKPKRVLIVVLSIFLGGVFGVIFVLVRNTFWRKK